MRGAVRRRHQEEEEESAFVSMTDMTVSFLFILMVLLAFFVTQSEREMVPKSDLEAAQARIQQQDVQLKEQNETIARLEAELGEKMARIEELEALAAQLQDRVSEQAEQIEELNALIAQLQRRVQELEELLAEARAVDPLESYLAQTADQRRTLLEWLRDQLVAEFPDLNVVISAENDALRFEGDGLFDSGSSQLRDGRTEEIVQRIAARLNELLPCFTLGVQSAWDETCNPAGAVIEAVQIEGHTDSAGDDLYNLRLSTERANTTYGHMVGGQPDLVQHLNYRDQPVLSVAGYGEMRPIADNGIVEGRATNRRIDLRIIMFTPARSEEIARIRAALAAGISGVEP